MVYAPDGGEGVAADAVRAGADDYVSDEDDLPERVQETLSDDDGDGPGTAARRRRERALRTLHEATRELMSVRDPDAVYRIAVHTARDVLSMPYATGFRHDEGAGVLRPVENTDAATETFSEPPSFDVGEGIAGDAFERGVVESFADATRDERADPEGDSARIRSYVCVPLGEYGLFTVADETVGAFDDGDVELVETLAANTEAALDRAARERELQRQNERLDRFAGVAGHDLRNPLAVARGHLEALRADAEPDAEPHLEEVETSLSRMDDLLERLLTLAREGETVEDPLPLSVEGVARDAWDVVDGEAALSVVDDPTVAGDRSRVQQLLENLFRNAVEHGSTGSQNAPRSGDAVEHGSTSPHSGPREDSVEHGRGDSGNPVTVEVGALPDGGFYVADDGPGIPPEERESVLESGVSKGGTGLGLAIVRRVAEAHGWSPSITESSAGGARVEVRTS